jgi:hypothetical protein
MKNTYSLFGYIDYTKAVFDLRRRKTAFYFYFSGTNFTVFIRPTGEYLFIRIITHPMFINIIKRLIITNFIRKTTVNIFETKKLCTLITEYANIFRKKYKPYQHPIIYIINKSIKNRYNNESKRMSILSQFLSIEVSPSQVYPVRKNERCPIPESRLWYYRVGRNRIRASNRHTEKKETLRATLEYEWCKKYASLKGYYHEQAMVESHRLP